MPDPYNISLDSRTGLYTFYTDQSMLYACKFSRITPLLSPLLGIYDIDVHEFMFYPFIKEPDQRAGHDARVESTLANLVTGYFTTPDRALIYLCDSSDGRAQSRQKLFARWADNMGEMLAHQAVEVAIDRPGGADTAYAGVMVRRDFPHPEILQQELVAKARGIVMEKFG